MTIVPTLRRIDEISPDSEFTLINAPRNTRIAHVTADMDPAAILISDNKVFAAQVTANGDGTGILRQHLLAHSGVGFGDDRTGDIPISSSICKSTEIICVNGLCLNHSVADRKHLAVIGRRIQRSVHDDLGTAYCVNIGSLVNGARVNLGTIS